MHLDGPPAKSVYTSAAAALLQFTVLGHAAAAGSKRAFKNPRTGKVMVTDANRLAKPWKQEVAAVAYDHHHGELLTGPLEVTMTFHVPRPRGHYGSGRNHGQVKSSAPAHPAVKPDVLKLARGVEDALTGIVWRDDAQIVSEHIHKRYGTPERVEIEIRDADVPVEMRKAA